MRGGLREPVKSGCWQTPVRRAGAPHFPQGFHAP
jgi:hypothetical protein